MLEKVFGFLANKCKVEVYSKEEIDEMNKVKTQSLMYNNDDTGVNIEITFKRTGNVVECFGSAYLPAEALHTFATSDFTGVVPDWAYPDKNFGKTQLNYANESINGCFTILLYKDGKIGGLYQNSDNLNTVNIANQFTYIVYDNNTEYESGDVDGNGTIDEVDLQMIQQAIMGNVTLTDKQFKAADINEDGSVTSSDYVLLKHKIDGTEEY